eukprot:m.4137 g.4137  ORF g.4137 m.4137 type:complete len:222 (+) comp10268_c0_seq1:37-702(+)
MASNDDAVDFRRVEKEFAAAVAYDEKYKRENDAKFRAIHQGVGTYEEFRDIVKASHLKSLDKKDKSGIDKKLTWNTVASSKRKAGETNKDDYSVLVKEAPSNSQEFNRSWRQLKSSEAKYRYLMSVGAERLKDIFKTEISFGHLGNMITTLNQAFDFADAIAVCNVLDTLSKTSRFSLNCQFLSKSEKTEALKLFEKLQESAPAEEERLDKLKHLYLQNTN